MVKTNSVNSTETKSLVHYLAGAWRETNRNKEEEGKRVILNKSICMYLYDINNKGWEP